MSTKTYIVGWTMRKMLTNCRLKYKEQFNSMNNNMLTKCYTTCWLMSTCWVNIQLIAEKYYSTLIKMLIKQILVSFNKNNMLFRYWTTFVEISNNLLMLINVDMLSELGEKYYSMLIKICMLRKCCAKCWQIVDWTKIVQCNK